jgi:HYDIN/CFA65/VesB family protein
MFLLKPTRPAFSGSILVTTLILATAIVAGRSAVSADSGAVLKLKPETHNFGQVTATKDSAPLIVTVTNNSSSAVTFTSIVATESFSIQSDKCSGSPLGPSKSCKVEIVFHPLVTGNVNAPNGLTFTDSAQNSPQQVELEGQGVFGSWL